MKIEEATTAQLNDELKRRALNARLARCKTCANCGRPIEDVGEIVPSWKHYATGSPWCMPSTRAEPEA